MRGKPGDLVDLNDGPSLANVTYEEYRKRTSEQDNKG